jgi:hypothetical protein
MPWIAGMTRSVRGKWSAVWPIFLLLFLLEVAAALWIVLLLQIWPGLPYLVVILFDSAWLGLVSGLGTRLMLKRLHWTVSNLLMLLVLFSGLLVLGAASHWHYGLGPQEFKAFDLAGATQVSTSLLACLLAATAWRKPAVQGPPPAKTASSQPQSASIVASQPLPVIGAPSQPQLSKSVPTLTQPVERPSVAQSIQPVAHGKRKKATASHSRGGTRSAPPSASPKTAQPQKQPVVPSTNSRPKHLPRHPEIQVAATGEHRCPYCLEIVTPNDPRGIVECKICHTLHHGDCWAITGACQVPHLNA